MIHCRYDRFTAPGLFQCCILRLNTHIMTCYVIQKLSSFIKIWGKYMCMTSGVLLVELSIIIASSIALLSAVLHMLLLIGNYLLQVSTVWFPLLSSDVLKNKTCTSICGSMIMTCSWLFNENIHSNLFHTKVKGVDWTYIFVPLE